MADPTRVWKFHARPLDEREVNEWQRLTSRYYNNLIEIERSRLDRFTEIRRELASDLAALEDAYAAADDLKAKLIREQKRRRQAHWRATKGEKSLRLDADLASRIERADEEKKSASAAAKPLRKAFNARLKAPRAEYKERRTARAVELTKGDGKPGPRTRERANAEVFEEMLADESIDEAWRRITESDARALAESKAARAACGLAPGTYLQVEDAVKQAVKMSSPRPPRHRRHDGKIAIQLTGHVTFADLLRGTSKLRLVSDPKPGRKGKSEEHLVAQIRVGSNPDRSPIWLSASVRLHRRPPDDARVRWAWIVSRKRGERRRYELQLVLQHPSFGEPKRPPGVGHGGHVCLGWASVRAGVRVAHWPGGELIVPARMIERAQHAERLIGHADMHYEDVVRLLRRWQALGGSRLNWARLARGERRRLWVRGLAERYAEHWLGRDGVRALWMQWRADRLAAGLDLHASMGGALPWLRGQGMAASPEVRLAWWLWTWARKDRHLRQWAADARAGFENARDALFRESVIRLSTQYETLTIDSYSIAKLKELPAPLRVTGDVVIPVAQHHVQLVAPGRFREMLREVMGGRCEPRERSGDDLGPESARAPRDHDGSDAADAAATG